MKLVGNLKQKAFFMLICANIMLSLLFAASTGTEYLETALNNLCCDLQNLIPVTAMLLVIAAGVIYSAGQMFGAETRARANVWATSCLTGAIIGIIISQVAPCVLGQIAGLGTCISCNCSV